MAKSEAATVEDYPAALPEQRRDLALAVIGKAVAAG